MKPYDVSLWFSRGVFSFGQILAMIEEAAGTKMYEVKKETAQKTIEKKDAKLKELKSVFIDFFCVFFGKFGVLQVINEELSPRLEKLRTERAKYMEYKNVERELEHMLQLYQAWEYFASKRRYIQAKEAVDEEEDVMKQLETEMNNHKNELVQTDELVEELTRKADAVSSCNRHSFNSIVSTKQKLQEGNENLQKAETELKAAEKSQAKVNASIKSITDEINTEKKKKTQLEKVKQPLLYNRTQMF